MKYKYLFSLLLVLVLSQPVLSSSFITGYVISEQNIISHDFNETLSSGQTKTIDFEGMTYEITAFFTSTNKFKFSVNGMIVDFTETGETIVISTNSVNPDKHVYEATLVFLDGEAANLAVNGELLGEFLPGETLYTSDSAEVTYVMYDASEFKAWFSINGIFLGLISVNDTVIVSENSAEPDKEELEVTLLWTEENNDATVFVNGVSSGLMHEGDTVSLDNGVEVTYLLASVTLETKLSVNGELTSTLAPGEVYEFSNGDIIQIIEIKVDEVTFVFKVKDATVYKDKAVWVIDENAGSSYEACAIDIIALLQNEYGELGGLPLITYSKAEENFKSNEIVHEKIFVFFNDDEIKVMMGSKLGETLVSFPDTIKQIYEDYELKEAFCGNRPITILSSNEFFEEWGISSYVRADEDTIVSQEPQVNNVGDVPCAGCKAEEKCYPYGVRMEGKYCSLEGSFESYKPDDSACENSYECASNQCMNSICISLEKDVKKSIGFLEKIFNWLKNLF